MLKFIISLFYIGSTSLAQIYSLPDLKDVLQQEGEPQKSMLSKQHSLHLLVWNILKHKRPGLMRDLDQLTQNSDLVLLQESMVDSTMNDFFNQPDGRQWYSAISFLQQDGTPTGVATGAKFASQYVGFIRSRGRESVIKTPKMVIVNEYEIENSTQSLLVANIHSLNAVKMEDYEQQLDELAELLEDHDGPMILAGDFNTWIGARMNYLLRITKSLKLKQVDFPNDIRKLKLDHIFVRGFKYKNPQIGHQFNTSDHKPLTVELTWK